jgi:hypothetical protein
MNACSGFGHRTKITHAYGQLHLAYSFVERHWEPRDEFTTVALENLAKALGGAPKRPSDLKKVIRCLSDVIMAARHSSDGLICWPTGSEDMNGRPYGRDVAIRVRDSLMRTGYLEVRQKSSKHEQLARIYWVDKTFAPKDLKFKKHRDYNPVLVRTEKRLVGGRKVGGRPLSRKKFLGQIGHLEEQLFRINDMMGSHPLTSLDGTSFTNCRRIFNNGSLTSGGRLYGDWQSLNEDDRLKLLIDGERVCEIDIKACFLCLVYADHGDGKGLSDDPYSDVPFVRDCKDPERRKVLRTVAKLLVVAYLGKKGDLTRFPKGVKEAGEEKAIPFKKRYNLNKNASYYMGQILETHPVLAEQKASGDDLMFKESYVMVSVMEKLIELGIPSYPVHDCIIVPISKKEAAIQVLSSVLEEHLGFIPSLDVAHLNEKGEKIETLIPGSGKPQSKKRTSKELHPETEKFSVTDWTIVDDYSLLE